MDAAVSTRNVVVQTLSFLRCPSWWWDIHIYMLYHHRRLFLVAFDFLNMEMMAKVRKLIDRSCIHIYRTHNIINSLDDCKRLLILEILYIIKRIIKILQLYTIDWAILNETYFINGYLANTLFNITFLSPSQDIIWLWDTLLFDQGLDCFWFSKAKATKYPFANTLPFIKMMLIGSVDPSKQQYY